MFKIGLIILSIVVLSTSGFELKCKKPRGNKAECKNSIVKITKDDRIIDDSSSRIHTELIIDKTRVDYLPSNIAKIFPSLIKLEVSKSGLLEINKSDFDGLDGLMTVDLSQNKIQELKFDVFEDLKKLQNLDLDDNQISKLPSTIFKSNIQLIEVVLSNNKISKISSETFKNLANLQKLYLNDNQLTSLNRDTFSNLKKLNILSIANNKFELIPDDTFDSLDNLIFKENYFTKIECIKESDINSIDDLKAALKNHCKPPPEDEQMLLIKGIKQDLKNLNLEMRTLFDNNKNCPQEKSPENNNNEIEKVRSDNEELRELNAKIAHEMFVIRSEMQEMSKSLLNKEEPIKGLFNLKCEPKTFMHKTDEFPACSIEKYSNFNTNLKLSEIHGDPNIIGLLLSEIFMIDFPMEIFTTLTQIKYVKIVNSAFGNLDNAFCSSSMNLEYLTIEKTYFGEKLKLSSCSKLKYLKIESTNMEFIEIEGEIPTLVEMLLRNNKIKSIPSDFFGKFINLENLQMSGNKIIYLSAKMFDKNEKLEIANFSNNPIEKVDGEILKTIKFIRN